MADLIHEAHSTIARLEGSATLSAAEQLLAAQVKVLIAITQQLESLRTPGTS